MNEKPKRKPGRPRLSDDSPTERLPTIRVTPEQLQHYKDASESSGMALSAWVRHYLDRAAKRNLKNK